jgi:hypothetical protein
MKKIVRRIYGPIRTEGNWTIKANEEIDEMIEREDIMNYMKYLRIRWVGHVERMNNNIK